MDFKTFCRQLNAKCMSEFGLGWDEMPDLVMVRDLFDDGLSVDEVYEICADEWAADDSLFAAVMGL